MIVKKDKNITSIIITVCLTALLLPSFVYADSVESSILFTGFKKLLEDVGKALIVIAIPTGIVFTAYSFIRKGAADEMEHQKWDKRIKTTIASTVGAITAGAIISLVSKYFGT